MIRLLLNYYANQRNFLREIVANYAERSLIMIIKVGEMRFSCFPHSGGEHMYAMASPVSTSLARPI